MKHSVLGRRISIYVAVLCVAVLAAVATFAQPSRAKAVGNGILQEERFSADLAEHWDVDGAYEIEYGDGVQINSLYFNAAGVETTNSFGLSATDAFTARGIYRGEAVDTAPKLTTDCTAPDEGFTHSGGAYGPSGLTMANGQFLSTNYNFIYFLLYLRLDGLQEAVELTFGECHDVDNAFSVKIATDGTVTLRNLLTESGTTQTTLAENLRFSDAVCLKLSVIGPQVVLSGRAETAALYTELARFTFEDDMPATYGKIAVRAHGAMTLSDVAVYTLDTSIPIDPDNYDPADEATGRRIKPLPPNPMRTVIIVCSVVGGVLVLSGAALTVVLVLRKKKSKRKPETETQQEEAVHENQD